MKKRGLGKGLDAIFADNTIEDGNSAVMLRLSELEPNRQQPRKEFAQDALQELSDSIAQHGVLQPLLVRPFPDGGYQIVAGERRWRAARLAGLQEVPVVVRELSDAEVAELALVENLQREDLSALEEANGYQYLIEKYGLTQEETAKVVGKSRPTVTNALRLLQLPVEVQDLLEAGLLSAGHARALLAFATQQQMLETANLAVEKQLSVREVERLAQKGEKIKPPKREKKRRRFFEEAELALKEQTGRKIQIAGTGKKGVLQIEFYGDDDLKELLRYFEKDC